MHGVVLSDDHPLLLRGLCDLLEIEPDFTVVGASTSGHEALALLKDGRVDIGVIDVSMPDLGGMDILRAVVESGIDVRIIFLTATITGPQISEALDLGVAGLLLKESAPEALIVCLREVAAGRRWLPPELVAKAATPPPVPRERADACATLTRREMEIAELVCRGYSNKMIARELGSSAGTIKIHLQNIYQKLQIANRTALASLVLN
ncbi:response regulator [Sphingobium cloacae]|uniref:Two component transcriptional regulator, LuxR family n=1 Tax=Sphingobium cloacae TaxID=120107 RepID=A0A1E1F552_9SPHN|nr:response regulator transcription factor [Sphingobium cloacae]BAV65646.1 two component transcriptional regulator, LuxR family [Sphingobium cloacae]